MAPSCEYLEWDSNFFGMRIARYTSLVLDAEGWQSAEAWCRAENIDCLYLLADSSDAPTACLAAQNNLRFVDARVLLERKLPASPGKADAVRPVERQDLDALQRIARSSHYDSRFFFDLRFPRSRSEDLFAAWIERSIDGWASTVFVAEQQGEVAGYVTCHFESTNGSIGLLAVDARHRGRGLGRQLMSAAMHAFEQAGLPTASVVTQARNVASQRLYQSSGFRTRSVQWWFHRWFQ